MDFSGKPEGNFLKLAAYLFPQKGMFLFKVKKRKGGRKELYYW